MRTRIGEHPVLIRGMDEKRRVRECKTGKAGEYKHAPFQVGNMVKGGHEG